jgi:hypothetical protein
MKEIPYDLVFQDGYRNITGLCFDLPYGTVYPALFVAPPLGNKLKIIFHFIGWISPSFSMCFSVVIRAKLAGAGCLCLACLEASVPIHISAFQSILVWQAPQILSGCLY